jgi:oligopeptide/dipeptide ABC transporter ATP-binding protein
MTTAAEHPVLEVSDLRKHFPIRKGLLRRRVGAVRAVDGVSFTISQGETLALVGESGCGKTTVSRCILRALAPSSGAIRFTVDGRTHDLATLPRRAIRPLRRHMQMVFQDPYASLSPRMVVADIIGEPLLLNGWHNKRARRQRVAELLDLVQLPAVYMDRYPHAFSGGQRQRIGIARALALNPSLIVADEPDRLGLSLLFVAHDLSVVKHVADRVAVMYLGRIVELAATARLYSRPMHPYTMSLLSAVPHPDPRHRLRRVVLQGSVPDAANPPPGCHFHPRCPHATERCRADAPELRAVAPGRLAACHYAEALAQG